MSHDLQKFSVLFRHHFLQFYSLRLAIVKLLGSLFDIVEGVADVLRNSRQLLGDGVVSLGD